MYVFLSTSYILLRGICGVAEVVEPILHYSTVAIVAGCLYLPRLPFFQFGSLEIHLLFTDIQVT